ncbi:cyclin-dependent kinase 20-like isoform X1 [Coccinella septempunctata]|uniref:cyclin-dependent kinase 20-like isoform X1 n=1 Tax=Coccinella septempunctata TaxID=41139 RepID=UPI001D07BC92|nr:cyclin-dependent kinase 20-like isoform X1 [Coccinella septempunctata]
MEDFRPLGRAGEGAHGFVFKAMDKKTHRIVALKKICFNPNHPMPKNTMREICALRVLKAPNIVELYDIRGVESSVVLVMEYLPCSLSDVISYIENPINLSQIKTYMKMFLCGVNFMHRNHIMHRDLKPSNLLISHSGVLKIADFGLARIYKKTDLRTYSHQVATRWYRAPELLYGSRTYTLKIDIWSVGCILGEMINKKPLFPILSQGETDIEQLAIVLGTLGTPDEEIWPGVTSLPDYKKISFSRTTPKTWDTVVPNADEHTLDLIASMLRYNEAERPEADEALNNDFFFVSPRPAPMKEMPPISKIKMKMNEKLSTFEHVLENFPRTNFR